jgi:hypothetical protein
MWEILYSMTSSGSKNKKFVITEIMSTKHTHSKSDISLHTSCYQCVSGNELSFILHH